MTDDSAAPDPASGGPPDLNLEWSPDLIVAISEAIAESGEFYELSGRVKAALPEELPDAAKALIRALDYHPRRPTDRPASADDVYGSMVTTADGYSYPEALSSVTQATVAAWSDAAMLFTSNDVLNARLHDLLWCVRARPRPDVHARSAHAAFRRLWGDDAIAFVHRSDGLIRALDLAVELRDQQLVDEVVVDIVNAVRQTLQAQEWAPGVAIPMIEALAGLREPVQPPELDALISDAEARYAEDPFIVEALLMLRMQRSQDVDERKRVALEAVEMWKHHAETRGGLVGTSHLERALELARNEGLSATADGLRALLQQPRTSTELGMEQHVTELSIPREVVDGFLSTFVDTSASDETFARLAAHLPITDTGADAELVRQQMLQHPLLHTFPTVVTNAEGMPLAHVISDEQHFSHALIRHHSMAITLWGSFLRQIFSMVEAEERLTVADMERLAQGQFVDAATAEGVARAYSDLLAGDYEGAMHRLLPRIERIVRDVARSLGLPVYREPTLDGRSLGAYKGLGELLGLLEGRVPEQHRRYFAVLLTERTGLNVRNRAAHGLMREVSIEEAALALHVMIVLCRWTTDAPATPDESDPSSR